MPDLSQIEDVQQSGRLSAVVLDEFDDDLPRHFVDAGHEVRGIERLTLEEIFLINVQQAKRAKS